MISGNAGYVAADLTLYEVKRTFPLQPKILDALGSGVVKQRTESQCKLAPQEVVYKLVSGSLFIGPFLPVDIYLPHKTLKFLHF